MGGRSATGQRDTDSWMNATPLSRWLGGPTHFSNTIWECSITSLIPEGSL